VGLIVILYRDLIRAVQPAGEVDQFASFRAKGKERALALFGFIDRLFADRSEHGGSRQGDKVKR
jgi:hypothetical protein